jgi:hypothetical protein
LPYPSEKKDDIVSWDDEIPDIWKNKKCSKPPTRYRNSIERSGKARGSERPFGTIF